MTQDKPDLDAAYSLQSPEDSRRLYAEWADDYDSGFAKEQDYRLHEATARAFSDAGGGGPILDVGAGTGLCGEALAALGLGPIDATDISPEMLDRAMAKEVYRDAIEADIFKGIPVPASSYAGVVSSGTFTTGHVGPDGIDPLLRVAKSGSIFALSINTRHYDSAGFAAKFAELGGRISGLELIETRIYGPHAEGAHKDDTAFVAVFKKV